MLRQRVITAAIGIPVLLGLIWWGGIAFTLLVAVAAAVAGLEFYRGGSHAGHRPLWQLGCSAAAGLAVAAHFGTPWQTGALGAFVLVSLAVVVLRHSEALAESWDSWLWTVAGVAYVGWLSSHAVLLRGLEGGRDWVLLAVFATFATDTAAYFVGRALGSRHLAPTISPGKTVEGAIGGLAGGLAAVIALNFLPDLRQPVGWMVLLGLLLPLAAVAGDLAESLFKRAVDIKDAGFLVLGHGGFLDRMDSLLFVVVVVYYFVLWIL